jgi:hypothetical protein
MTDNTDSVDLGYILDSYGEGLHPLGYKIFLDRYAYKNQHTAVKPNDIVLVLSDDNKDTRELGVVLSVGKTTDDLAVLPQIEVKLLDNERIISTTINKIDIPQEISPLATFDRVARGIAGVENSADFEYWYGR